jgi:hypothetical protein
MAKVFILDETEKLVESSFEDCFPFLKEEEKCVVSLVGAGGKTTTMFHLARMCSKMEKNVLVSTTTHIGKPADGSYVHNKQELLEKWSHHQVATVGKQVTGFDGKEVIDKLSMLPREELESYIELADIVFLEADGSKRKPLKVPSEKEPVFLFDRSLDSSGAFEKQSDAGKLESDAAKMKQIVIAVCGLNSIGHTMEEICFRLNEAEAVLEKGRESLITEDDIVTILTSDAGSHKRVGERDYYILLNQCDDEARGKSARHIAKKLRDKGWNRVLAVSYREDL